MPNGLLTAEASGLPLEPEYYGFAQKLFQAIQKIRVELDQFVEWKPIKEITDTIDRYLKIVDPDLTLDELKSEELFLVSPEGVQGIGANGWTDRLWERIKKGGNNIVATGVNIVNYSRAKLAPVVSRVKRWAVKHPGATAVIAFFGIPVTARVMLAAVPTLIKVTSWATGLLILKEAAQIITDTVAEEIWDPLKKPLAAAGAEVWSVTKWILILGGLGLAVYAFRDKIWPPKGRTT